MLALISRDFGPEFSNDPISLIVVIALIGCFLVVVANGDKK
jgi:hypothetical protein